MKKLRRMIFLSRHVFHQLRLSRESFLCPSKRTQEHERLYNLNNLIKRAKFIDFRYMPTELCCIAVSTCEINQAVRVPARFLHNNSRLFGMR